MFGYPQFFKMCTCVVEIGNKAYLHYKHDLLLGVRFAPIAKIKIGGSDPDLICFYTTALISSTETDPQQ